MSASAAKRNGSPAAAGSPGLPADRQGSAPHLPEPVFRDDKHHLRIYQGDCLEILPAIPAESVDLIFADPPYFLSNGGITCHSGRMVSVNKGAWDKLPGPDLGPVRARFDKVHEFNTAWLAACQLASAGPQSRRSQKYCVAQYRPTGRIRSIAMPQIKKKEVRRAIVQASDMLKRNSNPCETFEGVLSRGYVRALRTLIRFAQQLLGPRKVITRTPR